MSEKTFPYYAEAQLREGGAVVVDLEERGWADKELLAQTVRWTLLPKDPAATTTMRGTPHPFVVVNIPDGAKPVFKSRVYGAMASQGEEDLGSFRCFAIGYKKGRTTHLVWVMPTGDIEVETDRPWLADLLWGQLFGNR